MRMKKIISALLIAFMLCVCVAENLPIALFCSFEEDLNYNLLNVEARERNGKGEWITVALSELEKQTVIQNFTNARVADKAGELPEGNGSTLYVFTDKTGDFVASFEIFNGMLVYDDGVYALEMN